MIRRIVPKNAHLIPPQATQVFKGIIFDVYQWQQKRFDGSMATFEMLRRPDTVIIIGVKDGKLVVQKESQPYYGEDICFPGGRHDVETEDELDCAKRELHEETGMAFKDFKLVDVRQQGHKIEAFVYVFVATNFIRQDAQHVDAGEKISVELMSFDKCLRLGEELGDNALCYNVLKQAGSLDGLLNLPEYR
ncbi:MAG TPA: NUDIX domain-containing protein [Candidatus Saccharimonas sp.]|nr:NUDIX domain-containing protein [Candidatus Saccharimonas sp.]